MMQGPIQPVVRQRVESRNDARLPTAWIGTGPSSYAWVDGTWLTRTVPPSRQGAVEGPVLAMLRGGSGDFSASLQTRVATAARVYALVGPEWGKNPIDLQLLQTSRWLVRRVAEVPATGICVAGDTWISLGGGTFLRLDDNQTQALRHVFLHLFWHEATEEAWLVGQKLSWRPARERPFDVPMLPAFAPVRWEDTDARLTCDVPGSLVHLTRGHPPDKGPRRLWCAAGPDHHDRLERLAKSGTEILWDDRGLPDLVVAGEAGEVLLPGSRGSLKIRLNTDQASEISRCLKSEASWQFHVNPRIGDAQFRNARFWLPGAIAPQTLQAEQIIALPEVPADSLRAVSEASPKSYPAASPIALSVRYQWSVLPPQLPKGTEEDALNGRWRELDKKWSSRLTQLDAVLRESEAEQGRISRTFSRLKSAILGFSHTHKKLHNRIKELLEQKPSKVDLAGATVLLSELANIEQQVAKLNADVEEADRQAQLDEAKDRQEREWRAGIEEAKKELAQAKIALQEAERRQAESSKELAVVKGELATPEKGADKDLKAREQKLSDEVSRTSKEAAKRKQEIDSLERKISEPFEFRPPEKSSMAQGKQGGRFVPRANASPAGADLPEEALPEVGTLRRHKGQRYLVIERWEQLEAGEKAATRLQAILVGPPQA